MSVLAEFRGIAYMDLDKVDISTEEIIPKLANTAHMTVIITQDTYPRYAALMVIPTNVLVVSILGDSDLTYKTLSGEICVISFNAFSDTAIIRLLQSVTQASPLPRATLVKIAENSHGDARQALLALEMELLLSDNRECKSKRKRIRHEVESANSTDVGSSDQQYSLFHTIGKVLHNKVGVSAQIDKLIEQPVVTDSDGMAALLLHENLPDFTTQIDTYALLSGAFSFADSLEGKHRVPEGIVDWIRFKSIAVMNQDRGGVALRNFTTFRKSRIPSISQQMRGRHACMGVVQREVSRVRQQDMWLMGVLVQASDGVGSISVSNELKRSVFEYFHPHSDSPYSTSHTHHTMREDIPAQSTVRGSELDDDPLEDC